MQVIRSTEKKSGDEKDRVLPDVIGLRGKDVTLGGTTGVTHVEKSGVIKRKLNVLPLLFQKVLQIC